jgi:uncharacterized protein
MKSHRYVLAALWLLPFAHAHAASFNCAKAHSPAETVICHDTSLSKADDELGKLFRLAQRQAPDRRAYRKDSDAKWAWREANCTNVECLTDWYATRIDEIREQLDKPAPGEIHAKPVDADLATASPPKSLDSRPFTRDAQQCTAATPDLAPPVQCSNVLEKRVAWQTRDRASDTWFCGVAMIAAPASRQDDALPQ